MPVPMPTTIKEYGDGFCQRCDRNPCEKDSKFCWTCDEHLETLKKDLQLLNK